MNDPLSNVRKNFDEQVDALTLDLDRSSLLTGSKNTKRIVESFLNKDDLQKEINYPFELSFEKVYDYYKRSQYWVDQFDKKLAAIDQSADIQQNFLENSTEYKVLQALRVKQEENVSKIAEEYEFLLQSYNGIANDSSNLDLEEKLKRSVVAAKFLLRLSSLESNWRGNYPLVYEKIYENLSNLNAEINLNFKKYRKGEEGRKFVNAKENILAEVSAIEYESDSPLESITNREIKLFQKEAALKGEKISELANSDEIGAVEANASSLFGSTENNFLKPLEEISASKCIQPSLGSEGNLSGSELPRNNWVLTLDDGPSTKYTREFLQYLHDDGIKASFFMVAKNMNPYKSIVKDVNREEHIIGSHSWSHANLPKLSAPGLDHEIIEPNSVHLAILNRKPKFYRCPYGAGFKDPAIRQRIVNEGMVHVLWNVDTLDWQDKNPESIVRRALDQMTSQKRGIILFHDVHPQSLEASRELIKQLKSNRDINWLSIQAAKNLINKGRGCANDAL
jgi:peptidoglycan/xylan/chitin deacetylase (PgdA/CDA1 family)